MFQVVEILEEDDEFKKKLHNATEDEIKSGVIADHLDLISHKVRTKLDELKRMEIEYQRRLRRQEKDHFNGVNERNFWSPVFDENRETFESDDLRRLLHKVKYELIQISFHLEFFIHLNLVLQGGQYAIK